MQGGELGDLPFNQEGICLQELFQSCLVWGCKDRNYTALELTRLRGRLVAADMGHAEGLSATCLECPWP